MLSQNTLVQPSSFLSGLKSCYGSPVPWASWTNYTSLQEPASSLNTICLVTEILFFGFSFLKNTKFVSRACVPGHLPAAEALSSASYSHHSPASYPCVRFSQRPPCSRCCGHPDLGISLPTPTTDSPSCRKGLAAVNPQLSALGGNALNCKEPLTQGHTPFPAQHTDRSSSIVLTASNCGVSSATLLPARPCVNHS